MSETLKLEDFALRKGMKPLGAIHKIGIIGCGTTGQQISRIVSQSGLEVVFVDVSEARVEEVLKLIGNQLDAIIKKWGLTNSEKKLILSRIRGTTNYADISDCDIVIETIHTKKPGTSIEPRREIFRKVEAAVSTECVIASNVATLMISDLATVLKTPGRAIGMHFIPPTDTVKIVEVVKGVHTTDETYELISRFLRMIGKKAINVKESPGNISTRLIIPLINEACNILMEGVATTDDIDETMKEALGHSMGPFEMADKIGLDKLSRWMHNLYEEFGDIKYKPSPIIKRLVRANLFGARVGEGFYKWVDGKKISKTGSIYNLGQE